MQTAVLSMRTLPTKPGLLGLLTFFLLALFSTGCTTLPPPVKPAPAAFVNKHWQGKMALKSDHPSQPSFTADFELQGSPLAGELSVTGPLGIALLNIRWNEQSATLQTQNSIRRFASLDDLLTSAPAKLPVTALFSWLQGIPTTADGWEVDMAKIADGRLAAKHLQEPRLELKLAFEP